MYTSLTTSTHTNNQGFTLLELLLVISILGIFSMFLATPLLNFYRAIVQNGATEEIVTTIEEARKNTLSSYNLDQYGVHFETDSVTLFKGGTYSAVDPNNEVSILHSFVELSDISLEGGGSDLIFDRLTGETSQFGSVTLRLLSGAATERVFSIFASGLVEID